MCLAEGDACACAPAGAAIISAAKKIVGPKRRENSRVKDIKNSNERTETAFHYDENQAPVTVQAAIMNAIY